VTGVTKFRGQRSANASKLRGDRDLARIRDLAAVSRGL